MLTLPRWEERGNGRIETLSYETRIITSLNDVGVLIEISAEKMIKWMMYGKRHER